MLTLLIFAGIAIGNLIENVKNMLIYMLNWNGEVESLRKRIQITNTKVDELIQEIPLPQNPNKKIKQIFIDNLVYATLFSNVVSDFYFFIVGLNTIFVRLILLLALLVFADVMAHRTMRAKEYLVFTFVEKAFKICIYGYIVYHISGIIQYK